VIEAPKIPQLPNPFNSELAQTQPPNILGENVEMKIPNENEEKDEEQRDMEDI